MRNQRPSHALNQVDRLVQQSCSEIQALAELSLAWLEIPGGHQRLEAIARALQTMRNSAESLANHSHTEAELLDCGFVDQAEVRRREAAQVARKMTSGLGA